MERLLLRQTITKLLLVMKVAAILILLATTTVAANTFSQVVTITGKNIALTDIFESIHKQAGYSFVYEQKLLEKATPVTLHLKQASVTEVLNVCLKGQGLSYEIKFNTIIIREAAPVIKPEPVKPVADEAPPKIIKGKVTDDKEQPLAGVTVSLKGSDKAVTTDANGDFTISVPDNNAVLQFSYVGYTAQERRTGSAETIRIKLAAETKDLNQIVVVGYGTQKKRNITSAVASYNANDIPDRPLARVDQALVGQMAGVQVKQTTGIPGKAFSIQVRGSGSISAGNEPLYVIDGFPLAQTSPNASGSFGTGNPLDNINPNDIESIQVLKDASSAAIYGSRAANGVVLITTKKGMSGKPTINVNAYLGYAEASRKLDMLSGEEWIERSTDVINAQWEASGPGRSASQTTQERRQILGLQPNQLNTNFMLDDRWAQPGHPGLYLIDWQDQALRKGLVQSYQLSGSGGNEFVKYYASGNYTHQNGILIGMDYTNYAARANVEFNASKKLKFGINIAPSYSVINDPGVEGKSSIWRMLISFTPVQENPPGSANAGNTGQYQWANPDVDPIYRLKNNVGITKRVRLLSSVFAEYKMLDGLIFKITANFDNNDNQNKTYIPTGSAGNLQTRLNNPGSLISGTFNAFRQQTFVNENTLSYSKIVNGLHDISAVAGASYNTDKYDLYNLSSNGGYISSVVTTLNAALITAGSTSETKNLLLSYFGRAQYGFDNKYLVSASLRRDGSSRFGTNTKWGWFPSASVGWRISQEKFMQNLGFISDLKLRASWGQSGNYNIGDYSSLPLLAFSNYTVNNTVVSGQAPAGIVNPDLSWEKSKTLDAGIDAAFVNNRINLSFDLYKKYSYDLLLNVPIPGHTGFSTSLSNAGKVENKGWELELRTNNLTGKFQWSTSVNISHNTNKVTELPYGQTNIFIPTRYDIPNSVLRVGEPMYSINVVKQTGILTQEDINSKVALFNAQKPGDPKYFDANDDGVIDANDRVIVGHPTPDYTWGVTNTFRYKMFDLSVLVQGQNGGSIYSLLGRAIGRTGLSYTENWLGIYRDRWRSPDNPGNGTTPKAWSTFGSIKNTDWLYSSDYWRVRNITLGCDLDQVLKNKYTRSARVYATLENFFGKDKYKGGLNPEAVNEDLSGSSIFPDAGDYGGLPLPKSFIVGLNLTF
jgi:TonB-dependent starch-binding outer membrane protein SusC